ncbi:PD-(D/E)XK nuclease family protein [Clostridioides difficile]|nr:PD-(D/E)XK nuclease family protein [Clostridioides difficile]
MGLRFVLGRSGSGKSTYILDEIKKEAQKNETTSIILLVPEQYTFEAENRISKLFLGKEKDKYLRVRVLSFKTLSNIVFSQVGGLTDVNINSSGKAMMVYRAIEDVSEELNVFSKSKSQSGFVSSITDMISEMKQYNISPEMLENISGELDNETLSLKLKDISKIYNSFEGKLHENYVDAQDMLTSLASKIELSSYLDGACVYIDEFTGFTPNQYNVIKSILNKSKSVNISLTVDDINYIGYSKSDMFSRTKFTYSKLTQLCNEEGIKILPQVNLNTGVIKRFEKVKELQHLERFYNAYPYKIYSNQTENIKIKEFNNLYSEVEEIAREIVHLVRDKNVRYRDITIATRDLNRYDFLVHSIFNEYNIPNFIDKKREAKSNPIVILIISALEMKNRRYGYETMFRYLKSGLIGIDNDDINLLENYVLANGIKGKKWFDEKWDYRITQSLSGQESEFELELKEKINEIKNRVLEPIVILQEKLRGKNRVKEICRYIYEFLLDINMPETIESLIVNFKDKGELDVANQYSQVWDIVVDILDQMVELMGDEIISLEKFIKLITLGFDEYELGLVPPSIDQVLVSSVDRMKNPDTKYLYLVGTTDGVFPLITKDSGILSDNDRESLGNKGIEVDIDSKTRSFEEQFLVYKALTSTSKNLTITYPISDHEGKTLRPSIIISRLKKIFPNIENKSYLVEENKSTDKDILKKITVKSPTFNELINVIKNYDSDGYNTEEINSIWLDIYRYYLKIGIIVDEIILKIPGYILNSSERYKYLAYRLKNMLTTAITIISQQIKQGSFEPIDYEVKFGNNGKYPPIKMVLENGQEVSLIGQIDRVDEFEEGENKYIRIIDYKSGNKSISLTEIYYGLQLQLLVYLDAILESAKDEDININPAAILYCRINNPIAKFNEDKDDEEIQEAILKELRMKGLVVKDSHIVKEMDKSLIDGERKNSLVIPVGLTKDGNVGKSTSAISYEDFKLLRKYVRHAIKDLCEEMLSGEIRIAPYKHKDGTSCDFCDYSAICQFDSTIKDNKYKNLNNKSNEEIIKMMKGDVN